jgi:hypothetical protein
MSAPAPREWTPSLEVRQLSLDDARGAKAEIGCFGHLPSTLAQGEFGDSRWLRARVECGLVTRIVGIECDGFVVVDNDRVSETQTSVGSAT